MARTSIVICPVGFRRAYVNSYVRACLPEESPDGKRVPRFVPGHEASGMRSDGRTRWTEPDAIWGPRCVFHIGRKKAIGEIRRMTPAHVDLLQSLDVERDALQARLKALAAEEQRILDEAYAAGKPIPVAEIKVWAIAASSTSEKEED